MFWFRLTARLSLAEISVLICQSTPLSGVFSGTALKMPLINQHLIMMIEVWVAGTYC